MFERKISKKIIEIAKSLHNKNYLAAADGNISYRISSNKILITPSGLSKSELNYTDMAIVDLNGKTLKGRPSSELKMHLKVYERCKEAKAVIHAHPPISIAWTIAQPELKELAFGCISELILACGSIPIVPFAFPGTEEMADHLIPFLNDSRTMILARHGVLSWGESLEEAHRGVERIEHAAQVLYYAKNLGGLTELSSKDIEKLREMRKKIGNITL